MTPNSLAGLTALGGLVLLAVFVAVVVWLAWWMLEPINRAAGSLRAPTRFMLIDFLALMILLQVGLAICGQALNASDTGDTAARMYWALLTRAGNAGDDDGRAGPGPCPGGRNRRPLPS